MKLTVKNVFKISLDAPIRVLFSLSKTLINFLLHLMPTNNVVNNSEEARKISKNG